jgi:ribosome-interacting GTPase 1
LHATLNASVAKTKNTDKRKQPQPQPRQVRVYTKKIGHKPDFTEPVVLTSGRGGTTVEAMCRQVHNSLVREFKYALVWGASAKHYPQRVGLSHGLSDEDVLQARVVVCLTVGFVCS